MRLGLRFDLRSPDWGAPRDALYRTSLEMAEWADARGFELIRLSEHHGAEDGYLPSPLPMAAAVAARTETARIRLSALLVPLHDPVRLAEDLAVIDVLSSGRLECIAGAGYRATEFRMFGLNIGERVNRLESGLAIMRKAWTGEPFELDGRTIRVTPRPLQRPGPPLFLAGSSPGAARRAARIADGFVPTDLTLYDIYRAECERLGKPPGPDSSLPGPSFVHVADDPERAWSIIEPHALHETNSYAAWLAEDQSSGPFAASDPATIRSNPAYQVMTPDDCVAFLRATGPDLLVLHPLLAGLDPEFAWSSLELFVDRVWPHLTEDEPTHR